jgi:hypothetical protein
MDLQLIGIAVFLALFIGRRVVAERGFSRLSADEKVRAMDGFARLRMVALIPILVIFGAVLGAERLGPSHQLAVTVGVLVLLLIYVAVANIYTVKKLVALGLPDHYRKSVYLSQCMQVAALAALIGSFVIVS